MFNNFKWVVSLIRRLRPDLRKLFPMESSDQGINFMAWLINCGIKEYEALYEDHTFLEFLSREIPGLGLTPLQALIYFQRKDVQKIYPLPEHQAEVVQWFYQHGVHEHRLERLLSFEKNPHRKICREPNTYPILSIQKAESCRPFGVNLIGYAYGQIGIGEDIRMTAKCLQHADIPFVILNFPPGEDIPQNDFSMAEYISEIGDYRINIFCMTALETGRYYAEKGRKQFEGRYNIGYWPWELSRWPVEWMDLFHLVNEVWVSSRYTYDAVAPIAPVPVLIMPLAVELDSISNKKRVDFGLPQAAYLFCFAFDLNSSIYRKNPQACIEAFLKAFPRKRNNKKNINKVGLVIKVHRIKKHYTEWEKIKNLAAKDKRIHIIEETLSRPDLLALYKCCNCFLSLHRAEGYGRGIAEAILLGLHVITTAYSGNIDFCINEQIDLINYRLIPVGSKQYPFGENQVWAEANINEAAAAMRKCAAHIDSQYLELNSVIYFHPSRLSKIYASRLLRI